MSWVSTERYHHLINLEVNRRLGSLHSARILLHSIDFAEIQPLQRDGRWEDAGRQLTDAAVSLERGGADCALICANTMHEAYDQVAASISIPLLHIADAVGAAIQSSGVGPVALIGTKHTMERNFIRARLADRFQVETIMPNDADRNAIHRIIFEELVKDAFLEKSRLELRRIANSLMKQGAEGLILGCTEFSGALKPGDVDHPVFDTTVLHAHAAVDWALT